ncbi:Dyp-type peroxidase [Rugamonas sp. CCM 8940]|uniref:Dyp-type peroxidase n=1 Tax=Rugamonas sp. CCM 8940 TaxID=2765359 RepID=UPI0018F54F18|nr:hypothetical protein [Rugamonas sp. CCM 8940]MBJ7311457.1 hypothetical protein [Rugamonas sp. CCM 8940]
MADPDIDFADVQGTILRGYRVDLARHFVLGISDPAGVRTLLAALVDGSGGLPAVTTALRVEPKPPCFLNVSFSCAGLAALGLSADQLKTFDPAFQRGAASPVTADSIGDTGSSAPQYWLGGLGDGAQVHMLLSVWVTESRQVLDAVSAKLRAAWAGSLRELYVQDATALPDNKVHFDYRDSIAQPNVKGAPDSKRMAPDDQEVVATGEFLLGYANQSNGVYSVTPAQLSTNSSYAAFRILEQDVAAFNAMLQQYAASTGLDPELVAAKFCGRWRNGNPLELAPEAQGPVLPDEQLNNFHYVTTDIATDDTLGLKCPIGSHIRRNNPRDAKVNGTDAAHHRIVRRAMPYGPAYDAAKPDNIPRGLIGYFINANVANQFEFLTSQWNNQAEFVKAATGPGGSADGNAVYNISGQDIFSGVNDPVSSFTFAGKGAKGSGNTVINGFGRTIVTRGSVYCFFPSISGLRYLAGLG